MSTCFAYGPAISGYLSVNGDMVRPVIAIPSFIVDGSGGLVSNGLVWKELDGSAIEFPLPSGVTVSADHASAAAHVKGEYNPGSAYNPLDIVWFSGSSYIAQDTVAIGVVPPSSPWVILASEGQPGSLTEEAMTASQAAVSAAAEAIAAKDAADADAIATAADRSATHTDRVAADADAIATAADRSATHTDRVAADADALATAADRVQTGLDRTAVAADKTTAINAKDASVTAKVLAEIAATNAVAIAGVSNISELITRTNIAQLTATNAAARKTWRQATAPTYDEVFPPGVQSLPQAALAASVVNNSLPWYFWTNSGLTMGIGADLGSVDSAGVADYQLSGGHTFYATLTGTFASPKVLDISATNFSKTVIPGQHYEASVYIAAVRCNGVIGITWYGTGYSYISEIWSTQSGKGLEYNSGTVLAGSAIGGKNLSDYKRLWVHGIAPAGAVYAHIIYRGQGVGQVDPYLFVTRPNYGKLPLGQVTPSEWTAYEPPMWIDTSASNQIKFYNDILTGATWL